MEEQKKQKKPLFKRPLFWIILVVLIIIIGAAGGGGNSSNKEASDTKQQSTSAEQSSTSQKTESTSAASKEEESDTPTLATITKDMDTSTANATEAAVRYLNMKGFSKQGLIDQLSSEYGDQYTQQQATDAVTALENAGVIDWTEQAKRSAKDYLNMKGFSKQGLIDQLSSEYGDQFTVDEATAAVQAMDDAGEIDWNAQAVSAGKSYLNTQSFSRQGLIDQLSSSYGDKFTVEQATYAADQLGLQ